MKTIWKFPINYGVTTHAEFQMSEGASIVHVALDPKRHDTIGLWFEVDPVALPADRVTRRFKIIGTGQPVPEGGVFVGTVIDGSLVLHVFEVSA